MKMCNCGCGETLAGKKSTYRPGHDSRHVSRVARLLVENPDNANAKAALAGMSDKMKAKVAKQIDGKVPSRTVKVGRWEYPARKTVTGTERNTARDGSGEWVAFP